MTEPDTADTIVMRHLSDIEGAVRHVKGVLEPKFWEAVSNRMEAWAVERDWIKDVDPQTEGDYWLAPRAWQSPDDEDDAEFWFSLTVTSGDDGEDVTALAPFVGASAHCNRYVLSFERERPKKRAWQTLLSQSDELLQQLRERGFETDTRAGTIAYPVTLDAGELGAAFADEDFDVVLAPLIAVLGVAEQALHLFDQLVLAGRSAS